MLSLPNAAKARNVEVVTPLLNQFYDSFLVSLDKYVIGMNRQIEARRFFGKHLQIDEKTLGAVNVESSIGSYVADLIAKGELDALQERELSSLLKAYFN